MAVTIREVAKRAGVSVATVSRFYNGTGPVRDSTQARIRDAATALRYVPNMAARVLNTNQTHTLGVLLPDLYGEFFSEIIRGVDQAARQQGYHILLSSSHSDVAEAESALRAMSGRVDGLILMSPDLDTDRLDALIPADLPAILVNRQPHDGYSTLTIDNAGGARLMTSHLLGLGHAEVAFISGPRANHDAQQRLQGWRDAHRDAGRPVSGLPFAYGDFAEASGYDAAGRLLDRAPNLTALFAANDSMAIGALRRLEEAGRRVPHDIALAGFDDIPVARYVSPALSTVHVAISSLGAKAVDTALRAIEGRPPTATRLAAQLVLRESCGASASAALLSPGDASVSLSTTTSRGIS